MPPEISATFRCAAARRPTASSLSRTRSVMSDSDSLVGEERALLEQHAHALAQGLQFGAAGAADVLADRQDLALLRDELAGGRPQQRGLARTRAAHDGDHLARAHVHGDIAQDGEITVA
ncbi:hypothetical protein G6F59_018259 [Rhizopus arrhizus]|nr:hypothetical protein G6F59_018259 [Rhizopus arrhizus]